MHGFGCVVHIGRGLCSRNLGPVGLWVKMKLSQGGVCKHGASSPMARISNDGDYEEQIRDGDERDGMLHDRMGAVLPTQLASTAIEAILLMVMMVMLTARMALVLLPPPRLERHDDDDDEVDDDDDDDGKDDNNDDADDCDDCDDDVDVGDCRGAGADRGGDDDGESDGDDHDDDDDDDDVDDDDDDDDGGNDE